MVQRTKGQVGYAGADNFGRVLQSCATAMTVLEPSEETVEPRKPSIESLALGMCPLQTEARAHLRHDRNNQDLVEISHNRLCSHV